jgi:hypothetical protein
MKGIDLDLMRSTPSLKATGSYPSMVRRCPFDLLLSGDRNVEFSFSREEELLNEKAPIF